jgi:predicted nucleotidyltransferase
MTNFKIIRESILDPKQEKMNPYVWEGNKLNPKIKEKIEEILQEKNIKFHTLLLIGSLATKFWTEDSDLDITVLMDETPETILKYREIVCVLNDRYFFGTFPINFFFRSDSIQDMLDWSDGIYNITKETWVKKTSVEDFEEVLKNPKKLAMRIAKRLDLELEDIAQEVSELVEYYNNPSDQVEDKINLLQMELETYISELDTIHKRKNEEFLKVLEGGSLSLVKKYSSRNILPHNLVFKYLVKMLYYKWQGMFRKKLSDGKLDDKEIKELFHNFVRLWK